MDITEVKIRKILDKGYIRAIASIVIDDVFAVHDIKIVERKNDKSLFLAMPSRRNNFGQTIDIVHPMDAKTRQYLEQTVLKYYQKAIEE